MTVHNDYLSIARKVLREEAAALHATAEKLDSAFEQTVETILKHSGKCVISGIGKSGRIAQKIASTFSSTGTPAAFMHAGEAMHGDLGIYQPGDPSILISKSGSTVELLRIIPTLRAFNSPLIAIVSNTTSPLAEACDYVLDASIPNEADPLGIVPTTSAVVTLGLGDALACALMEARNFQKNDFARFHPAGQLGRNLLLTVKDVMHALDNIAILNSTATLRDAVIAMTEYPLGAACVLDGDTLLGIITDGDIRRVLREYEDIRELTVASIMTREPIHITPDVSLADAVQIMEDRPSQISVLPVLGGDRKTCLGLLRIHDIYQPNLL